MGMQSDDAFLAGLDFFSEVVGRVPDDGWERPSACGEWRVVDVLGHVGGVVQFGTALLNGEQPPWGDAPDPPGAMVEGDPAEWWSALVEPARTALAGADLETVIDSPVGPRSIGDGLGFPAIDLFVHAWDMGRPLNLPVQVPDHVIEFARQKLDAIPEQQLRSARLFGQPMAVPNDATESDRFIAWTGRDPRAPE
jgi:uncharacterized protein (TIGR03086 family)